MKTFKRTTGSLVGSLTAALGGGILVVFLFGVFGAIGPLAWLLAALVVGGLTACAILLEDVRIELDEAGGRLRYLRRGKLLHDFDLSRCHCHTRTSTSSGPFSVHFSMLFVRQQEDIEEVKIDCSALGLEQCFRLYALVDHLSEGYTETLDPRSKKRRDRMAREDAGVHGID